MAQHKFDGKWNYFEMPHLSAATTPGKKDDMFLTIPENGEVDDDNSNQGDFKKIDGKATNANLDLVATDEENKVERTLKGKVVVEQMCNGVPHIVIAGRYKDKDIEDGTKAQEEGTWVITKP